MRSLLILSALVAGSAASADGSLLDPRLITGVTELSSGIGKELGAAGRGGETRDCAEQSDCHSSSECYQGRCVVRGSYSAPNAVQRTVAPPEKCPAGAQCVVPSSSLRRKGSEIYLRERMVELREELALGRGPVISGLANVEQVPAKKLGRSLREHHTELLALIGDGSDPSWSVKFLIRVDQLCGRA